MDGMDLAESAIKDISVEDGLVRYAANMQVVRSGIPQIQLAKRAGIHPPRLNEMLTGKRDFDTATLQLLDKVLGAADPEGVVRTGGLASFAAKLQVIGSGGVQVPSAWTPELLEVRPDERSRAVIALLQGSALVSALTARGAGMARSSDPHIAHLRTVVDRLLQVGVFPPTSRSVEALLMIGQLARHGFDQVDQRLDAALEEPLGFRVWRAFSTIVRLSRDLPLDHPAVSAIQNSVRLHLDRSASLRAKSLYPARSLDLELAIVIPRGWTPPGDDWAGAVLRERVRSRDATVRERAMAAMGLWERAIGTEDEVEVRAELETVLAGFEAEAQDSEVGEGLLWAAATTRQSIGQRERVCNTWPTVTGRLGGQVAIVRAATEQLRRRDEQTQLGGRMRTDLLVATQFLIEHAVLQNAGVARRRAIDTIRSGGWMEPAAVVLGGIAGNPEASSWLRSRALFALGFLQERTRVVHRVLLGACRRTWTAAKEEPNRSLISEAHSALFAVGDCFGAVGAEEAAGQLRRDLATTTADIVMETKKTGRDNLFPIARAACYMIAFTGNVRDGVSEPMLQRLLDHPDEVTGGLSAWALDALYKPSRA